MSSVNKILNITCCFFITKENESLFVFLKECESSFENIDISINVESNITVEMTCLVSLF